MFLVNYRCRIPERCHDGNLKHRVWTSEPSLCVTFDVYKVGRYGLLWVRQSRCGRSSWFRWVSEFNRRSKTRSESQLSGVSNSGFRESGRNFMTLKDTLKQGVLDGWTR